MSKSDKFRWSVQRKENGTKVTLARYAYEDIDSFKIIAKNPNYIILEDGKNVTSKYKKIK